ncbi:MAG TPA: hypothetical protein VGO50_12085 [Pyrinomonadaceae bacterium]|jgi:hypothetical protein|nr:hypothetical protein [Pyrinomonadaceae bacterium]
MKKFIPLLFVALILGLIQVSFAQAQDQMQLRVGQQKSMSKGKVRVKFISVTEDSRCPADVDCVWAGNAKVKIQVWVRGGETKVFELGTNGGDKAGQADAYRVELVSLTPARHSKRKIRQNDYRATFSIMKLTR